MEVFYFNDTATTEIYTLYLHAALPITDKAKREEYERLMRQKKNKTPPTAADEVPTMKK